MTASYHGATGADYDKLIDTVAAVSGADELEGIARLHVREELRVPAELSR